MDVTERKDGAVDGAGEVNGDSRARRSGVSVSGEADVTSTAAPAIGAQPVGTRRASAAQLAACFASAGSDRPAGDGLIADVDVAGCAAAAAALSAGARRLRACRLAATRDATAPASAASAGTTTAATAAPAPTSTARIAHRSVGTARSAGPATADDPRDRALAAIESLACALSDFATTMAQLQRQERELAERRAAAGAGGAARTEPGTSDDRSGSAAGDPPRTAPTTPHAVGPVGAVADLPGVLPPRPGDTRPGGDATGTREGADRRDGADRREATGGSDATRAAIQQETLRQREHRIRSDCGRALATLRRRARAAEAVLRTCG